jgi:hypothetical protein
MDPGTMSAVQGFAAVSLILGCLAVLGTGLRWVWLRTGRPNAPATGELEELRGRVADLEADRGHMAELEERLDFAERMLAQQREPDRLERP